jgi:hypothetical protein
MPDRTRHVLAALVALVLALMCAAPIARAQDKGSIEIDVDSKTSAPPEREIVVIVPIPQQRDKNRFGGASKNDPFKGDLEPGIYEVIVQNGGTAIRWIRIEKGEKAVIGVKVDEIPRGLDTGLGKNDADLVASINKAAKDCEAIEYHEGMALLNKIRRELKAELDGLEKLVKEESERTHLPDNEGGIADVKAAPMSKETEENLKTLEPLIKDRDRVKARLKTVDDEFAAILPLKEPCDPKPAETPPPKPEEKPKPKEGR